MTRRDEQLDPNRLLEAAEAAMEAVEEVAAETGRRVHPLDLLGSPEQPRSLCAFTRWEIEQACEFLHRLGELEMPRARDVA